MEVIGEKISQLRKIKGISQEELAEQVGVSRQTIYKWESNQVQPNADNVKLLCDIFSVGVDYFYKVDPNNVLKKAMYEVAIADSTKKRRNYIILIILLACVSLVAAFFAIWSGCIAFTNNVGDANSNSIDLPQYIFIVSIILMSIALTILIVFIIKFVKIRNVNQM